MRVGVKERNHWIVLIPVYLIISVNHRYVIAGTKYEALLFFSFYSTGTAQV